MVDGDWMGSDGECVCARMTYLDYLFALLILVNVLSVLLLLLLSR